MLATLAERPVARPKLELALRPVATRRPDRVRDAANGVRLALDRLWRRRGAPGLCLGEACFAALYGIALANGAARLVDLVAVITLPFRVGRMVEAHRLVPAAPRRLQLLQELRRIGDIGCGVEGLGQRFEGVRMIAEIDLHTADIDVADAAPLQGLHCADGRGARRIEFARPFGGDRPGPGNVCLGFFVPPAGFHRCDGGEQTVRDSASPFLDADRVRADIARVFKRLPCLGRFGIGGEESNREKAGNQCAAAIRLGRIKHRFREQQRACHTI